MTRLALGSAVAAIAIVASCTPTGQANVDTSSAASTTPVGVGIAIPDSAGIAAAARNPAPPTPSTPRPATKPAATGPSSSAPKPRVKAPIVEDDIIGKDSVIRFPARVPPNPSSTPTR